MWMSFVTVPGRVMVKSECRGEVDKLVGPFPAVEEVEHAESSDVKALAERF